MLLWCEDCGRAVMPDTKAFTEYHSEVDTRRYETKICSCCPYCGEYLDEDYDRYYGPEDEDYEEEEEEEDEF